MDILTFIAELVKATAWPLAAITIALIFRQQLRALLSRIRKGKVGPAEFEFEQEVKELTEQAPLQSTPPEISTPTVTLATTNPRAAILDAWLGVESSIKRLAYNSGLPTQIGHRNPSTIMREIEKNGILQSNDVALFNDLRVLRNQATHDPDFSPSPESVVNYVQLAHGLKHRISSMSGWYELSNSRDGQFHFSLKSDKSEIILASEFFKSLDSAENGISSVQRNSPDDSRYERKESTNGKYYFVLKSENDQIIGNSQMYPSASSRDNGIELVKKYGQTHVVRRA